MITEAVMIKGLNRRLKAALSLLSREQRMSYDLKVSRSKGENLK